MDRVVVVGTSGSGKTTVARQITAALGVPALELDSLHNQANWVELELTEFRTRVSDFVAAERWVVDGNYRSRVADLIWPRADTIVWLDLPRWVVMRQVVRRTVRRTVTHEELWNGNREPWTNLLRWDPHHSIIRWAWTQHARYQRSYGEAIDAPENAHLTFVRLTSLAAVDAWLASLAD